MIPPATAAMSLLDDMALVVSEEIADSTDTPLRGRQARYVAACLIVGMQNRGWEWRRPHEITVTLTNDAATIDQVEAFIASQPVGQP